MPIYPRDAMLACPWSRRRAGKFKGIMRHSGAMRSIEPQMRNCASENLEIPGLVLRTIPE
jgi:hypothetical protein